MLAACSNGDPEPAPSEAAPPAQPTQAAANTAPTNPTEARDAPVIVFLGDSLTAGFELSPKDALPGQVASALADLGVETNAVNAGVSGDTTANGLARYDWSVASADPDLLVVALGANDYLLDLSPETTRANLAAILGRAKADGTPVVLAGITPRSDAALGSRDAAFGAIYPELAAEYDVPLLPGLLAGVRDNPDLLLADGLHPTAEGVAIMASNLATVIAPELAALSE